MGILSGTPATTVEKLSGDRVRYRFSGVNMVNIPAQLTDGFIEAKAGRSMQLWVKPALAAIALGVFIMVRDIGGDPIFAILLAGIIAGAGMLALAISGDQPVGDVVVTVSNSRLTVQRCPRFLIAPIHLPKGDILSVTLMPSFPGTFTAGGMGTAMRPSSAIVLQRRTLASLHPDNRVPKGGPCPFGSPNC